MQGLAEVHVLDVVRRVIVLDLPARPIHGLHAERVSRLHLNVHESADEFYKPEASSPLALHMYTFAVLNMPFSDTKNIFCVFLLLVF